MPHRRATPKSYEIARKLRKKHIPAETKLWACLRGNQLSGISIRRQHPIWKFIVDFCSPKEKLIIELDGSQHLTQETADTERTKELELQGYKVIRFWNDQVLNDMEGVLKAILNALEER